MGLGERGTAGSHRPFLHVVKLERRRSGRGKLSRLRRAAKSRQGGGGGGEEGGNQRLLRRPLASITAAFGLTTAEQVDGEGSAPPAPARIQTGMLMRRGALIAFAIPVWAACVRMDACIHPRSDRKKMGCRKCAPLN